ncbi:hypothetical protein QCA50_012497 [Cerrena zonata]|uniref:Uncharacterized protein n=1 Tax=Cerrena zonata TaxID=2478898 RepID=A0AAW0G6D9_9APHY
MPTGANPPHMINSPKPGGSPRTLIIGTGAVAATLFAFWCTERYLQTDVESQRPNWQQRVNIIGEQSTQGTRNANVSSATEPRSGGSAQIPLPNNDVDRGSNVFRTVFSAVSAGKDVEHGAQASYNSQRKNAEGTTYTKAGSYASGYKEKPQDYGKTP